MADTVFACPACHQNISCDSAWVGQQIQCPLCHQTVTMPGPQSGGASGRDNPLVPRPPAHSKLSLNQNAQQPAPTHQRNIPIRNLAAPPPKKEGPWKMIAQIAAVVALFGVAGWFAWPFISAKINPPPVRAEVVASPKKAKHKAAEATPEQAAAEQAAPGQPAPGQPAEPGMAMPGPAPAAEMGGLGMTPPGAAPDGSAPPAVTNVAQTGPVIPPIHNLELAASKTPSGRVNGKISGGDFLPEIVRIDQAGTAQALQFVQGDLLSPDRALTVYLRLKPGEKLQGQKIEVTSDQRTSGLPQVVKRWKSNPKYAPNKRSFSTGYAMRLEITSNKNGVAKGKIYVALPDAENSVVGGSFSALCTIPAEGVSAAPATIAPGQAPAQMPGMAPMGGERVPTLNPEFQKRYGGR